MRPFLRSYNHAPETKRQSADGSGSKTETALHRTRLHYLDHKNFAKEFLRKAPRQPAPLLGFFVLLAVAHRARICSALQESPRCQRLTVWLT